MPLEKLEITNNRAWARWKIDEQEEHLASIILPFENVPNTVKSSMKRLEWIAGRILVKTLMEAMGMVFQGVTKDDFGKPFPIGCEYQLALSHSYPYAAALIDKFRPVGIDVEQLKPKLLKIASRVLDKNEMLDAGDNLVKHCIYWCAKETLVKVHGKKDLIFAENLKISPFIASKNGNILGRIIVNTKEEVVPLMYTVEDNFVMVLSS
jgi:4'-phosphopantetheinyl transferase